MPPDEIGAIHFKLELLLRVEYTKRIAVVIINFNGGKLLVHCVQAALASSVGVEVVVVDNGSGDGSIYRLRKVIDDARLHIIENFANLGFARAVNIGIRRATGEFILLLNPDCIIQPDTIERMISVMQEYPRAGMAGCLIRNRDGSEQVGCRRRVPTPARTLIRILHLNKFVPPLRDKGMLLHQAPLPERPESVEAISGAFMLVRRQALDEVGLMDEDYFLHCEDLDWCMRFRAKGWNILFVPDVEVVHEKGTCSINRPVRVEWHKHRGMVRFYRKFFRHQYPSLLMGCVVCAVWARFLVLATLLPVKRYLR